MTANYKYQPNEVNAMSWEELGHFYTDLISHNWPLQAILPFIEHIKASDHLNQKIFACTSLDKLIISIYNPIELQREAIHIQYDKEMMLWCFKYYPYPYHEPEHERNYPGELLIEKFQNYINLLNW